MVKVCPECRVELVREILEEPVEEYDKNGKFTGYGKQKIEFLYCPSCNTQFYEDDDTEITDKPEIQENTKPLEPAKPEAEAQKPVQNLNKHNFIDNYTTLITEITNVTETPARAMLQYLVAHALSNARYENSKGKINANLSFIWVAPSGSNKTPLIENGINKFLYQYPVFVDFREYGQVTGKGFRQSVAKIKDDIIKASINWDEASVAVKDAKSPATADLFEVLSQAFDGKMIPYDSIRGGSERYKPLFVNIWLSGTPIILQNISESFWYQGFGLRTLFLDYKVQKPHLITDDVAGMKQKDQYFKYMAGDLGRMQEINEIKTTTEFMEEYNKYQTAILDEIQKVQSDITTALDHEVYATISKVKYPVLVMKLAMVYSASRFNFDDKGVLTLDIEDLERAKNDLDIYHKNMVEMFNAWEELVESKSRIETISNLKRKMERHIIRIIKSGKSFEITHIQQGDNIRSEARMKKGGKWVPHTSLLRNANIKARDFNEIVETLLQQMFIVQIEANIATVKDGGEYLYPITTVFYSINQSK